MIESPLNDRSCLEQVTGRAREFSATEGRELVAELGLRSVPELVEFVRNLPQRNDKGDPADGPKVSCDVLQRLRLPASDPNCFERTALVVALGELLAPGSVWQMATMDTAAGRHTYPTQDGRPVDVDPVIDRSALEVAQFAMRQASGMGHTLRDLGDLVGQLALRIGDADDGARIRDGVAALRRFETDSPPSAAQLEALGFALGLAERSAQDYGPQGADAMSTSRAAIADMRNAAKDKKAAHRTVRRKKKKTRGPSLSLGGFSLTPDLGGLSRIGSVAAKVGGRVASGVLQAKLASLGISPDLIRATEKELQQEGLTLGSLVPAEPKTTNTKQKASPLDLLLLAAVL